MRTLILNGETIGSRRELYDAMEAHLPLPEYFGRNLDALHDVLLHEILPGGEDLTIEIEGYDALYRNLGEYAVGLKHMLNDVAHEDSRFKLILR